MLMVSGDFLWRIMAKSDSPRVEYRISGDPHSMIAMIDHPSSLRLDDLSGSTRIRLKEPGIIHKEFSQSAVAAANAQKVQAGGGWLHRRVNRRQPDWRRSLTDGASTDRSEEAWGWTNAQILVNEERSTRPYRIIGSHEVQQHRMGN